MNRARISDGGAGGYLFGAIAAVVLSVVTLGAAPIGHSARGKPWSISLLILFGLIALLPTVNAITMLYSFFTEGFQQSHLLIALASLIPGASVWWGIHMWQTPRKPE